MSAAPSASRAAADGSKGGSEDSSLATAGVTPFESAVGGGAGNAHRRGQLRLLQAWRLRPVAPSCPQMHTPIPDDAWEYQIRRCSFQGWSRVCTARLGVHSTQSAPRRYFAARTQVAAGRGVQEPRIRALLRLHAHVRQVPGAALHVAQEVNTRFPPHATRSGPSSRPCAVLLARAPERQAKARQVQPCHLCAARLGHLDVHLRTAPARAMHARTSSPPRQRQPAPAFLQSARRHQQRGAEAVAARALSKKGRTCMLRSGSKSSKSRSKSGKRSRLSTRSLMLYLPVQPRTQAAAAAAAAAAQTHELWTSSTWG